MTPRAAARRILALASWCMLVWTLLTWTLTLEQVVTGLCVSLAVAAVLAPLGPVAAPWRLARPSRLRAALALLATAAVRVVGANVKLAARIWSPHRPLSSGMVITTTTQQSALGLTVVGLVSSLIVDNQLVDLDRAGRRMQYHAVAVPPGGPEGVRAVVNGPIERHLPGGRP